MAVLAALPTNPIDLILASLPSAGALETGGSISMFFLGVATLQAWNYYRSFPDDPLYVKATVAVVYILDLVQAVLFIHVAYQYTINGFVKIVTTGNFLSIVTTPWSLQVSLPVTALIIVIVESYLCLRVYRITERRALALGCWCLSLVRLGLNSALAATVVRDGTIEVVESPTFKWLVIAELSIGTASDICIAASICIGLLRRRTGFERSNRLVDRLIAYAISSGALTSLVLVVALITYLTKPTQYVWLTLFSLTSKLFSNSLLASLNQRSTMTHRAVSGNVHISKSRTSTRIDFHKAAAQQGSSGVELSSVHDTGDKATGTISNGSRDDDAV